MVQRLESHRAGVECLSGIPGTVGGTPVQNVGAYGQEVSETITAVRCFDRTTGDIVELVKLFQGTAKIKMNDAQMRISGKRAAVIA